MSDPYDLERFVTAQDRFDSRDNYQAAERELLTGRKWSHWIWFVFPQLDGVGANGVRAVGDTSKKYAIKSRNEARAYLEHEVLGSRLHRCAQLVVKSGAVNANTLMGGYPDDLKLRSSMTLFAEVAQEDADFVAVLREYYGNKRDPETMRLLRREAQPTTPPISNTPAPEVRGSWWPFRRAAR